VRLWQAVNPSARNFRLDVIGAAFTSTPLESTAPDTWLARVDAPQKGWKAFFVEMRFDGKGKHPLKMTSGVRVVPDTLPYPAPKPKR
jgi:PhoPQ-activated pathogenicity-related protein